MRLAGRVTSRSQRAIGEGFWSRYLVPGTKYQRAERRAQLTSLVAPGSMLRMVAGKAQQEKGSQLLHGVLDLCLLSIIDEEPSYGYEMVNKLSGRGLNLASEGSIYPLLSRLQKQGIIDGYLVPSSEGPARKYYRTTAKGRTALVAWREEWITFRSAVDEVLGGHD